MTSQRFFFCTYLRSTLSIIVRSPWTKQLLPSLYLPVAATTSGGWLQPFAVPAAHTPCERPADLARGDPMFLSLLDFLRGLDHRTRYWNWDALPMLVVLDEYICMQPSAFIRYILSGAKLVTAYLVWKVKHVSPQVEKISTLAGSIVFRKPCKLSVGTLVKHRKGYIKR